MALVFDIETIPSHEAEGHWAAIGEMAARREQEPEQFAATCPVFAEVVCVGFEMTQSGKPLAVYNASYFSEALEQEYVRATHSEGELLIEAARVFAKAKGTIATFNGRAFDIPTLIHRMRINGMNGAEIPEILLAAMGQKPWERQPHVDLALEMSFGRATSLYPLRAYALAYGIPDPKAQGNGEHVAELIAAGGSPASLIEYQLGDVRATAELYRRVVGG